ncbi:hypothetical protein BLM37_01850 [Candidatus Gracilibacteria bacterium GN02-873]|jgi:hypothetical protein|nr:hypothetical protein BLM37_01850 [Candidatus Gracilibacteria bacterium GN02-873]
MESIGGIIKNFFDFIVSLLTSIFGFVYVLLKGAIFLTLGLIVVAIVLFFIIKATTNYTIDGEKLILSKLTHKVEINISDIEKIEDSIWSHWHYNRDFSIGLYRIDLVTKDKKHYTISPGDGPNFVKNLQKINPEIISNI